MRMQDDDLLVSPVVDSADAAATEVEGGGRVSHVLVFNARREVLLRPLDQPGVPHGTRWTSGITAPVEPGESYDMAATRALRHTLGVRMPVLRFVDRTWIDEGARRTFLGVFVIMHESPFESAEHAWFPVEEVVRALRHDEAVLDPAFARVFRALHGEPERGSW